MPVIFILALGCFVLAMLWLSGAFSFGSKPAGSDTLAAMRTLLQARAEGKIGQEEFERAQAALHLAILDQPATSHTALRVIVPVLAVTLVLALGYTAWSSTSKNVSADTLATVANSAAMPALTQPPPTPAVPAPNTGGDLSMAVQRLEAKLEKNPNNRDGWLLLAQSYKELGRIKEAEVASARAAALTAPGK